MKSPFPNYATSYLKQKATICLFLTVGSLTCIMMPRSFALPSGQQVTSGSATFTQMGTTLTIKQSSDKLITNWKSFSIGSTETTQFIQPTATSAALNRVNGGAASLIDGRLLANGKVILINPAGITVGAKGIVNVNSFIASTQDLTDADFLNAGDDYFYGSSQAGIRNLGVISASGGDAILVAKQIENAGSIAAPKGTVALAGATQVLIRPSGEERIFIQPKSEKGGSISQTTAASVQAASIQIKAAGNPYATAINLSGILTATGAGNPVPKILAQGGNGNIQVNSDAKLTSRNAAGKGGLIAFNADLSGIRAYPIELGDFVTVNLLGSLDARGTGLSQGGGAISAFGDLIQVNVNSRIDVSASGDAGKIHLEAISQLWVASGGTGTGGIWANSTLGNGGTIYLLAGENGSVWLTPTARISASLSGNSLMQASKTAGNIRIGGGLGGAEPGLVNAGKTVIEKGAQIAASGAFAGNGGTIGVWSATDSVVAGSFYAKGGSMAGNGGFVEVSADQTLDYTGLTDTTAPAGSTGMLLLDPDNILIKSATNLALVYTLVPSTTSILTTQVLKANLASSNVTVETDATAVGYGEVFTGTNALFGETQFGKIVLVDDLVWSKAGNTSLTLNAQGSLLLLASIANLSGGDVNLNADTNNQYGGDVFIGSGQQTQAVSVESLGKINVRGQSIHVLGSNTTTGASARIGNGKFTQQFGGDITLNAMSASTVAVGMLSGYPNLGVVNLYGGSKDGTAAQVGHGGQGVSLTAANVNTLRSDIRVNANNGGVVLQAGAGDSSYSQIGHGGRSAHLDTGNYASNVYFNLSVNARSLSLFGGKVKPMAYAQVGLGGLGARLDIRNNLHADTDLILTGTNGPVLNLDSGFGQANNFNGSYTQIGIGGASAIFNLISQSAFIQIAANGANAILRVHTGASGDFMNYSQIGHGGFYSTYGVQFDQGLSNVFDPAQNTVFRSAPITINALNGTVQVLNEGGAYSRIGHGQSYSGNSVSANSDDPTHIELSYGNINLTVKADKVLIKSFPGAGDARIGHGACDLADIGYLSQSSTISIQATGTGLNSFVVDGEHALIGTFMDGSEWDYGTTVPGVDHTRKLIFNFSSNVQSQNGGYAADGVNYMDYLP